MIFVAWQGHHGVVDGSGGAGGKGRTAGDLGYSARSPRHAALPTEQRFPGILVTHGGLQRVNKRTRLLLDPSLCVCLCDHADNVPTRNMLLWLATCSRPKHNIWTCSVDDCHTPKIKVS